MPEPLSAKLRALGVKVGARDVPAPPVEARPRHAHAIDSVVPGRALVNADGECYLVENAYADDYLHGHAPLHAPYPLGTIAQWARDERMAGCPRERMLFLDIETTGLAGGTGVWPFMVGLGWFGGGQFVVEQLFMRNPLEEAALLSALAERLAACDMLVTFNGKAFDVPLLKNRYGMHRRTMLVADKAHLDLLSLARRLWRDRLASRALGSLEQHILGARRSQSDVPGWMIPTIYFEYLRNDDARPLKGVFYHNALDIVAMAALLGHVAQMTHDPLGTRMQHPVDYLSLGRMYEEMGQLDTAARIYEQSMNDNLPDDSFREAARRLSAVYRRTDRFAQSLELWLEAAKRGEVYALINLAMYYEHRTRDYAMAERMTFDAIRAVSAGKAPPAERRRLLPELQYRLERVQRKGQRTV
ncbi:MAG: ribonuclease H-like domain-containing protein [Chloroflexi bacterium]|nr:ribonuclease H-like domain-containing protein [Chloroflexota bacterium]